MSIYNKSAIMKRAWNILRAFPNLTWSQCLTRSWRIEKENVESKDISPVVMNRILNGLRSFNRSRTVTENKPLLAGTQEHFKILNSKTGRKIMKRSIEDESKQMLESGELFQMDIIHQRIKESKQFTERKAKIKTTFRSRIINLDNCIPVNIEDYV